MIWNKSRSKFGNIKQTYGGYSYHSKKEAEYAAELDWRVKAKDIKSWDRQYKVELRVYGVLICNYYLDFAITHNDGRLELVEIKGFSTDVFRLKWKLFEAIYSHEHPEIIRTFIKV